MGNRQWNRTNPWWRLKWKPFPRYWPFVRGIHRSPVNSPHEGQWGADLMFSLICAWRNIWVNNRVAVDLWRHGAHYDVIIMRKRCAYLAGCPVYASENTHPTCSVTVILWIISFSVNIYTSCCKLQWIQDGNWIGRKSLMYHHLHTEQLRNSRTFW